MRRKNNIERISIRYYLLKKYVDFCFRLFYKVRYIQKERINTQEGNIFACNHQNALMDALAILTSFTWQPVFLARADIFKNNTIARILQFLKILPVYRIRDGYEKLSNNQQVFDQTFQVLKNGTPIAMFPEGNHVGIKNVRNLKKGIARIAFSYRHETSEIKDLKIIPVGLNYESYHEPGSSLFIQFGEPILISAYDNEYADSPAKATNTFLHDLKNSLQLNSLHIENEVVYPVADLLAQLFGINAKVKSNNTGDILKNQKNLISRLESLYANNPDEFKKISIHADSFNKKLQHYKIKPEHLEILFIKNKILRIFWQSLFLTVTLPLYIYSLISNIIPVYLIERVTRLIKDPQFKSSVFFVGSILVAPVIHLIQAAVVSILLSSLKWGLVYLLGMPLSYWFKLNWERLFRGWKNSIKLMRRFKNIREDLFVLKKIIDRLLKVI